MLEAGFAKVDITPRVGVELCGFGPFVTRHSIGVRDRLSAKAMAVRNGGKAIVLVGCDLVGVTLEMTRRVRALIQQSHDIPDDAIMVHCSHTHSGPNTVDLIGWGEEDTPYRELLPDHLARACVQALDDLSAASIRHAEVPCEGIGLNREYDKDAQPLEDVLKDDWRPAKPELTDTTCHVITVEKDGALSGFLSYFGCHPVVCCSATRFIHGDYAGVASNLLEREHPGSVGLFLQGAQGDVNTCVVHKPEQESLLALDVIAARYARSVREGIRAAAPIDAEPVCSTLREAVFSRKQFSPQQLNAWLSEKLAIVHAPDATDEDRDVRMATVYVTALRRLIARKEAGDSLEPATEIQGLRVGPVSFLGCPFETFQAIKNDVASGAKSSTPLVMGITNDLLGYAPDRQTAERGGYAADMVPLMLGQLPFRSIHDDLVKELLEVDAALHA